MRYGRALRRPSGPPPMPARIWLFIPTYNEAANIERSSAPPSPSWRRSPPATSACSSWTTSRRTGPARSPTGWPPSCPRSRSCTARARTAWAAPTSRASATPSRRGGGRRRHGRRLLPRPGATCPLLLGAAEHSDVVLGSRYVKGGRIVDWPPMRRILSRGGSLYARTILGVHVRDLTGGFKWIHRRVLLAVEPSTLRAQGYVFNIELTYRAVMAGFKVTEVPITFRDRTEGVEQDVARHRLRGAAPRAAPAARRPRRRPRRRGPRRRGRRGARPHAGPLGPPRQRSRKRKRTSASTALKPSRHVIFLPSSNVRP